MAEIARELGVPRNRLCKWQTELRARGATAFSGPRVRKERTTEITRLKRELARANEERDILKNPSGILPGSRRDPPDMQAHQREFPLTWICEVLQVSRSGFYPWQRRGTTPRSQTNQLLIAWMRVLHQQMREAYGTRKRWQLLNRKGLIWGRHRVARLPAAGWDRILAPTVRCSDGAGSPA